MAGTGFSPSLLNPRALLFLPGNESSRCLWNLTAHAGRSSGHHVSFILVDLLDKPVRWTDYSPHFPVGKLWHRVVKTLALAHTARTYPSQPPGSANSLLCRLCPTQGPAWCLQFLQTQQPSPTQDAEGRPHRNMLPDGLCRPPDPRCSSCLPERDGKGLRHEGPAVERKHWVRLGVGVGVLQL